jgi:hypothetical protein
MAEWGAPAWCMVLDGGVGLPAAQRGRVGELLERDFASGSQATAAQDQEVCAPRDDAVQVLFGATSWFQVAPWEEWWGRALVVCLLDLRALLHFGMVADDIWST